MKIGYNYIEYLTKLKKDNLVKIIKEYNKLAVMYHGVELSNIKAKKDVLVKELEEVKENFLQYFVMSLDINDLEILKTLVTKKCDVEFLNENKNFVNYLVDKKILWQKDSLELPKDISEILKNILKNKEVLNHVKEWDRNYKLVDGMVVAYGVVDREYFDDVIKNAVMDVDLLMAKLDNYYKKDYSITNKMIKSNKLTNKKRIDKYFKDTKYYKFTLKEYVAMGSSTYHHVIKAYKKLIKMLRSNYVFKKSDIEFVDKNIVIPYLYNSLNEEEVAKKNLEDTVISLFEFKGDKLKQKMLKEIMAIRSEFPLWEYRGYTKESVEK